MSTDLTILVSLEDPNDLAQVHRSVRKTLPGATIASVPKNSIHETISEQLVNIAIIDSYFNAPHSLTEFLASHNSTVDGIQTILILPDNKDETISKAIEHDVSFYLSSPINTFELDFFLKRLKEKHSHLFQTNNTVITSTRFPGFFGESPSMQKLFDLITRIAEDDFATVLIRGESGTGKELVARAIHSSSKRKKNNFVPVNCAAIPDDLLESELFGHIKGSFTGATQSKQGRIQFADQGTLFLDEIGDMKPALQAKLLRVLQEKEFEPVGSLKAIPVDTRIVAATHCDLEEQVKTGQFREDLYYRLSVIPLEVPPLRNRVEDIPILLKEFINTHTTRRGRKKIFFTRHSLDALMSCEWRGNVRELENLVQHMSILYSGKHVHPHDLPEKYTKNANICNSLPVNISQQQQPSSEAVMFDSSMERAELLAPAPSPTHEIDLTNGPIDFNQLINEFEKELIIKAMRMTEGNKKEAARILNLKRTTLLEKIKKKDLNDLW